jgi:transglutaminase/protease-like cytokinesis protein 3
MFINYRILFPFLFFTVLIHFSFGQQANKNFAKIDAYAKSVKGITDIGKLSRKLTAPYKTDLEKVRSIFRWITENIEYDTKEYHLDKSQSSYSKLFARLDQQDKNIHNLYDLEIAKYVLKNKKGICAGYASLFKSLCDSSKLKAEIISGAAKTSVLNIGTAIPSNHAWNAIYLENKWQLLDATWASGYCDDSVTRFTKNYNDNYFLTLPNKFIMNHYPDDRKWILFNTPPTEIQFYNYPLVRSGYFENEIGSFSPSNGIIEGKIGNKISFEIRIPKEGTSISVNTKTGSDIVKIKKQEKIISYEYTVTSDMDDELTIFMDGSHLFSYRIVVVPGK